MPVLDHLSVSVNDREASLRFYTEILGFEDGDSFDRADNMKGPGFADGAHGGDAVTLPVRSESSLDRTALLRLTEAA